MLKVRLNLRKVIAMAICLAVTTTIYAQNGDIYMAGKDGKLGKVWKNSVELYSVADGTNSVNFDCIYVSGNDVFTGGTINDGSNTKAVIWKNGLLLYQLTSGNVQSISVSGDNVYVCGSYSTNAVLWENNTMTTLGQGSYHSSSDYVYYYATAMQVVGNDVYVVGYTNNDRSYNSGRIWKNGTELYWVANAVFTDIAVSGENVYISGYKKDESFREIATVWKNGDELYSEPGDFSAMSVFGNDVYVAGYTINNGSTKYAKVWKNGTVLYQLTDGTTDTRGNDICVKDNDVYVLTRTFAAQNKNIVWKNGVELYDMGSQVVNAICLPSSATTAVENIEIQNLQNLQIYPNPVKDKLFIQSETGISKFEIYDITGKQMLTGNMANIKSINISALPTGIYVLKIGNYSGKFVKE